MDGEKELNRWQADVFHDIISEGKHVSDFNPEDKLKSSLIKREYYVKKMPLERFLSDLAQYVTDETANWDIVYAKYADYDMINETIWKGVILFCKKFGFKLPVNYIGSSDVLVGCIRFSCDPDAVHNILDFVKFCNKHKYKWNNSLIRYMTLGGIQYMDVCDEYEKNINNNE